VLAQRQRDTEPGSIRGEEKGCQNKNPDSFVLSGPEISATGI
jgi:hypothetical protein